MKIEIVERNYKAKDKLKDLIEKKLDKMQKYLGKEASARVVLSKTHEREKMEVNVRSNGLFIRSEVESDNMYANLDNALAKIERQAIKYSGKLIDKKRNNTIDINDLLFYDELPEFKAPKITKRKEFELTPMGEDEAIENLELLGNSFYVYKDAKTDRVCVMYKRNDGDYGLIITD